MLAAVLTGFGGPEMLELRTVPVPRPGAGEVLVRVTAAALNNTDLWTRRGAYGLPGDPDALAGWRGPVDFPRIQGGDIAGEVAAVGDGVDPGRVGRRVVVDPAFYDGPGPDAGPIGLLGSEADGGFAGYVVAADGRAHDVTDSPLSDEQLAALPVAYGTAAGMLARGRIGAGETVFVTGSSGGVGLAAVQLASARGARVVALTAAGKRTRSARRAPRPSWSAGRTRTPSPRPCTTPRAGRSTPSSTSSAVPCCRPCSSTSATAGGGWWRARWAARRWTSTCAGSTCTTCRSSARRCTRRRTSPSSSTTPSPGASGPGSRRPHPLASIHAAQEEFSRGEYVGKIVVRP